MVKSPKFQNFGGNPYLYRNKFEGTRIKKPTKDAFFVVQKAWQWIPQHLTPTLKPPNLNKKPEDVFFFFRKRGSLGIPQPLIPKQQSQAPQPVATR